MCEPAFQRELVGDGSVIMSKLPDNATASIAEADLDRLMTYHDRQFVELAYRLLLDREADEAGLVHHLDSLRAGESRREIAWRIADSEEGRARKIERRLFERYLRWRRIEKIPVLGAFLLLILCIVRIRYIVGEFRRLQNAAHGGNNQF